MMQAGRLGKLEIKDSALSKVLQSYPFNPSTKLSESRTDASSSTIQTVCFHTSILFPVGNETTKHFLGFDLYVIDPSLFSINDLLMDKPKPKPSFLSL